MDFYERKKKTLEFIDRLVETETQTTEDIIFNVLKVTAMGKKFVTEYLNNEILTGRFVIEKGTEFIKIAPRIKAKKKEASKE
jgi:hypothetical protein